MNAFNKIYSKIITESYISEDENAIDNRFYEQLKEDVNNFVQDVQCGEGWIAKQEILQQFLIQEPDWDCQLFNKQTIENYLEQAFKKAGVPMKSYNEIDWNER